MKSVVLLSGGLDSTVILAALRHSALRSLCDVEALTVDYGQIHRNEIDAARRIADHYSVPHLVVAADRELFVGSSLTGAGQIPTEAASRTDSTYVPARNTVLIALASARAEAIGARLVFIGANADDANAYPDCRPEYISALNEVLKIGTASAIGLLAPLTELTKKQIVKIARDLDVPLELTRSCYRGGPQACGRCGACQLIAT